MTRAEDPFGELRSLKASNGALATSMIQMIKKKSSKRLPDGAPLRN